MTNSRRLLVLAIDAANPSLLKSWAADGTLPTIARLMASGFVVDSRNVEALYTGSAWPSFYLGVNPAEHGVYWLDRLADGAYRTQSVTEADFATHPAVWDVIGRAGNRVLVFDVPVCRLSPDLNGLQVIEWGTHDHVFDHHTNSPALTRRLGSIAGAHPGPRPCDAHHRSHDDYRRFADQLIAGAELRGQWTRQLLQEEPWDFAIQVFGESHCAGHQLWHFHDPAHPAFDAQVTRQRGDLIREVYVAIDAAIGRILEIIGPDTAVMVTSLHSVGCFIGSTRLLPEILVRLGAMARPSEVAATTVGPRGARSWLRAAYHRVPRWIRTPIFRWRERLTQRATGQSPPFNIDPERSRCFPIDVGQVVAGIRLNLRGREPRGVLDRGAEAEAFCAMLTDELLALIDPDTGRPLVRQVYRTAQLHRGARIDQLPDLLVEWDDSRPIGTTVAGSGRGATVRAQSPRIGVIESINDHCRTGEHRIEGMVIARGPGIPAGRLDRVVSVLDLAPTLARFMGCDMPTSQGTPIAELLG